MLACDACIVLPVDSLEIRVDSRLFFLRLLENTVQHDESSISRNTVWDGVTFMGVWMVRGLVARAIW